ncbi:DNA-directed RNA polymerase II, IV and V subunit 8B [Dorcoceras hygrometricum]|uniref:DNA-directed RNA polymerase II, IV and V subunit 8B n=1 Tax=Dorcoceras hygrometricum TaxID=472368 RepID=A0A2Z7D959_9LAMI|nr:DNA-directed RNA polymerase II, IV and V subunit 8B [Dorcoceras hygrometricum]
MLPGEKYRMVISNSLYLDGSDVSGNVPQGKQESLASEFEFVMHGLLYKISEAKGSNTQVEVYISFGGLKLMLRGDLLKMHHFSDRKLFLSLRKM